MAEHEKFRATLAPVPKEEPPWMKLRGAWSGEEGEKIAHAINEMFPPWTGEPSSSAFAK